LGASARLPEIEAVAVHDDFNVKVLGYLRCIREVVPAMRMQGGGRIVNVGGIAMYGTGSTVRSMRNAAVAALTKSLADELAPDRIAVCAVHPGNVRTEATPAALEARAARLGISTEGAERSLAASSVLGRMVEVEEIAELVAFLASPRAVAINGDAISAGNLRGTIRY
jgi:NAD(P)-dependent dehydrogenase (short-subunit alcohol dehydrogenase family)